MANKKYFDNSNLINTPLKKLEDARGVEFESYNYLTQISDQRERFIPNIDFTKPENFAYYGLAEKYYSDATERVINNYPYDGSHQELVDWYNNSTYFDLYIFENEYPRTNGYAIIAGDSWGKANASVDGYGLPDTIEYIKVDGGPNTGVNGTYVGANKYNPGANRNSNLALNVSSSGATVEFWLKKDAFVPSLTNREVIFDLWNNITQSAGNYGRLRVEFNTSSAGSFAYSKAFRVVLQSGSNFQEALLGDFTTNSSFTSQSWKHYAFTVTSGSSKLYINGKLDSTAQFGTAISDISGAMSAYIGSLITDPGGPSYIAAASGSGKLTGSLDEFRYWKTTRQEREIKRNWFTNVYGGTNTVDANTDLGVYFKFNEGITGDSTTDSIVLDYSGRISNGSWVGYTTNSRNIGSAIVSASSAKTEFKDPILRSNHPDYISYVSSNEHRAKKHDLNNSSNFYLSFPDYIIDEDEYSGGDFKKLAQAISSYFDTAHMQIRALSELKDQQYVTQTGLLNDKAYPFASHLLTEKGLFVPELFLEKTILENLSQKTEDFNLESDLFELKNLIYQNIYNNLNEIAKKKGTHNSIRNFLHNFGVDENLIKVRVYNNNEVIDTENETEIKKKTVKFADFNPALNNRATVYQTSSLGIVSSNDLAYIPASTSKDRITIESFVNFPNYSEGYERDDNAPDFLISSLFGFHDVDEAEPYNAWATTSLSNLFVRVIKDRRSPEFCYFEASSSLLSAPLTSSNFNDVYLDSNWHLAVQLKPKYRADFVTGSSPDYDFVFKGYSYVGDVIKDNFSASVDVTRADAQSFLQANQKVFLGAERQNFTGSVNTKSDARISTLRFWLSDLTDSELKAHAKDPLNAGIVNANDNLQRFESSLLDLDLDDADFNVLNWSFETVTGSNSTGGMTVYDLTSGSAERRSRGSYVNTIAGYNYLGASYGFPANSTSAIYKNFLTSYTPQEFDGYDASDLIFIKQFDYEKFGLNRRFVSYVSTAEKSAQASITDEMLKLFGTMQEFASFIGQPVHRYRFEYKNLRTLREKFFQKIDNDIDVEKFLKFYKWLDTSISYLIKQVVPTAADFKEDVFNVIESHLLERNKYRQKKVTLKPQPYRGVIPTGLAPGLGGAIHGSTTDPAERNPDLSRVRDVSRRGISRVLTSRPISLSINQDAIAALGNSRYQASHPDGTRITRALKTTPSDFSNPLNNSEEENPFYWKFAADRAGPSLTTGDTNVDSNLNTIKNITLSTLDREMNRPWTFSVGSLSYFKSQRKSEFWSTLSDFGSLTSFTAPGPSTITVSNDFLLVDSAELSQEIGVADSKWNPNAKTKKNFEVGVGPLVEKEMVLKDTVAPFTLWSSSVDTGYQDEFSTKFASNTSINNLHDNAYSGFRHAPLQSPFTSKLVGGWQYRSVDVNSGDDDDTNRPEGFFLLMGPGVAGGTKKLGVVKPSYTSTGVHDHDTPRATLFKGPRSPVNTTNIRSVSSSLGNFSENYEVFNSTGRLANNRFLVKNTTEILSYPEIAELNVGVDSPGFNQTLSSVTRTNNKSIIANRFDFRGRGYSNPESEEYSPQATLNYKYNKLLFSSGSGAAFSGSNLTPRVISTLDTLTRNDGLRVLLTRHATTGGYDSVLRTFPSYHKVNRNPISSSALGSQYDNFFIQHPIPRTMHGYTIVRNSYITDGERGPFSYRIKPLNGTANTIPSGTTSIKTPQPSVIDSIEQNSVSAGLSRNFLGLPSGSGLTATQLTDSLMASITDQSANNITNEMNLDNVPTPDQFIIYSHGISNNIFGYHSFMQIRGGETKQSRNSRENNTLYYSHDKNIDPNSRKDYSISQSRISPLVQCFKQTHSLRNNERITTVEYPYVNEYVTYPQSEKVLLSITETDLIEKEKKTNFDFLKDLYTLPPYSGQQAELDSLTYRDTIWPKRQNRFNNARIKPNYYIDWWNNNRTSRTQYEITNSFGVEVLTQSIWSIDGAPLDVFEATDPVPSLFETYLSSSNPTNKHIVGAGELLNNCMLHYAIVQSDTTSSIANGIASNNTFSTLFMETGIKPGPVYARPKTVYSASVIFTGPAASSHTGAPFLYIPAQICAGVPWTVLSDAESLGLATVPAEVDYNNFREQFRSTAKFYSQIPEFKISNSINQILESKDKLDTQISPLLSLSGAIYQDDSNLEFNSEFTNSDLLHNFTKIKNSLIKANIPERGVLRLKCNVVKKAKAEKGFYWAQRTQELATLFSQSFSDLIDLGGTGHPLTITGINSGGDFRTAAAPFFAPGILFNTIKSGIGYDFPVMTGTFDALTHITGTYISSSSGFSTYDSEGARVNRDFDLRLPFESLLDPLAYVDTFVDSEPGENAILNSAVTFQKGKAGRPLYTYAMHNFLASVSDFFLETPNNTIISAGENSISFDLKKTGGYQMDLRIFEEDMTMYKGEFAYGPPVDEALQLNGSKKSYLPYLPPYKIKDSNTNLEEGIRFTFNPTAESHTFDYIINNLTKSYLITGSSKALDNRTKLDAAIDIGKVKVGGGPDTPEYALALTTKFETPILDGSTTSPSVSFSNSRASVVITVNTSPADGNTLTVTDGAADAPITYTFRNSPSADTDIQRHATTSTQAANIANKLMSTPSPGSQIPFTIVNNFETTADVNQAGALARAYGKMYNMNWTTNAADMTIVVTSGSGFYDGRQIPYHYPAGFGHNYCLIPTGSQGVKLQVKDVQAATTATGSLADALGLSKNAVSLGTLKTEKVVKEAVIAIPYINVEKPDCTYGKQFFEIDEKMFAAARAWASSSRTPQTAAPRPNIPIEYNNLAIKMRDFMLPPQFDFYNRNSVFPFAMFIFEYKLKLNTQDLSLMWQNVFPSSLSNFVFDEDDFSISFGEKDSWFPQGIPDNIRWMTFKVKQRGALDYFEQQRNASLFAGKHERLEPKGAFTNPLYSYNWPYDFFSFVEMGKIDVDVQILNDKDINIPAAAANPSSRPETSKGPTDPTAANTTTSTPQSTSQPTPNLSINTNVPFIPNTQDQPSPSYTIRTSVPRADEAPSPSYTIRTSVPRADESPGPSLSINTNVKVDVASGQESSTANTNPRVLQLLNSNEE